MSPWFKMSPCSKKSESYTLIDMKNYLVVATVLLLTSVILSACTPPNPDTENITIANPPVLSESELKVEEEAPMPAQVDNVPKSLSDFKEIPATKATITTNKGDLVIELYREKTPITTANFVNLASEGYYDGIIFHRVIPGFMAQVGDPLTKNPSKQQLWGTGGPGYVIPDEFDPSLTHDGPGVVSMANAGPNTGGSQFFITFDAQPHLDGKHAVFGKIIEGLDVLENITQGDSIISITLE